VFRHEIARAHSSRGRLAKWDWPNSSIFTAGTTSTTKTVNTGLLPSMKVEDKAFPKIFIQSGYYEDGSAFTDALNCECH
jgi:hypothetical protein